MRPDLDQPVGFVVSSSSSSSSAAQDPRPGGEPRPRHDRRERGEVPRGLEQHRRRQIPAPDLPHAPARRDRAEARERVLDGDQRLVHDAANDADASVATIAVVAFVVVVVVVVDVSDGGGERYAAPRGRQGEPYDAARGIRQEIAQECLLTAGLLGAWARRHCFVDIMVSAQRRMEGELPRRGILWSDKLFRGIIMLRGIVRYTILLSFCKS